MNPLVFNVGVFLIFTGLTILGVFEDVAWWRLLIAYLFIGGGAAVVCSEIRRKA